LCGLHNSGIDKPMGETYEDDDQSAKEGRQGDG